MANWISAILFAIEALGFVGVLFLLHRVGRTVNNVKNQGVEGMRSIRARSIRVPVDEAKSALSLCLMRRGGI